MSWIKNNEWLTPEGGTRIRWEQLRRFAAHYAPFRGLLALAAVLAILGSATAFVIPQIFYRLQTALVRGAMAPLVAGLALYLGVALFETATTFAIRVIRARISTRLNRALVLHYYGKLLNVGVEDFVAFRRRTNLFQRVIDAMSITPQFTDVLVRGGQAVIVVLVVGTAIGVISLPILGVLSVGAALLFAYALLRARELRELRQRTLALNYPLVGKMTEAINGLFTIKALAASPRVTRDIQTLVDEKTEAEYLESRAESGMLQFTAALKLVTLTFSVALGVVLLNNGAVTFAELLALYLLSTLFLNPVTELASLYQSLARLSVNVANFYEVADLPDEASLARVAAEARASRVPALALVGAPGNGNGSDGALETAGVAGASTNGHGGGTGFADGGGNGIAGGPGEAREVVLSPGGAGAAVTRRGHVVFEGVEFAYAGGPPVLRGIDLEIFPGEKIALIGKSGVGKTTLMRLLLGFHHPSRGSVALDGEDVATCADKNAYRRRFGVVGQSDVLFGVSIRENLAFGLDEDVSEARMEEALRGVGLWDDVGRLPEGLDSTYSEDLFSGGQRQRFFIARALLRRPSVVLLDEPTSALDFESERLVMQAIDRLVGGKTTLTIAHRLSTVRGADRVVVLDDGIVRGMGTHEELYRSNDYYRALCDYNSFVV